MKMKGDQEPIDWQLKSLDDDIIKAYVVKYGVGGSRRWPTMVDDDVGGYDDVGVDDDDDNTT